MKKPIKYIFLILIVVPPVLFSVYLLFGEGAAQNQTIFNIIGSTLENANVKETPSANITINQSEAPIIIYNQGAHEVDTSVDFKTMFTVYTSTGEKNGKTEDDFSLYLSDIRNKGNVSVLEFLTTEQIEALEEIPSAFIYDKEKDILYFHQSGIYTVMVNVYGTDGSMEQYYFALPVEAKE